MANLSTCSFWGYSSYLEIPNPQRFPPSWKLTHREQPRTTVEPYLSSRSQPQTKQTPISTLMRETNPKSHSTIGNLTLQIETDEVWRPPLNTLSKTNSFRLYGQILHHTSYYDAKASITRARSPKGGQTLPPDSDPKREKPKKP